MTAPFAKTILIAAVTVAMGTSPTTADEPAGAGAADRPVRVLMITGGCCHDYQNQKRLISEGLSQRVGPIRWTILQYGSDKDTKANVYQSAEWIEDFDIVVHNECFGAVEDGDFVSGIVEAHLKHGVPAIMIHCSMHSYRAAPTADRWRELIGVTSRRHERKKGSLLVKPTAAGRKHPALASLDQPWQTPNGELYIIERVWPATEVLATAYSDETGNDEPVVWANVLQDVRVFGISLGHHNETIEADQWQSIVADGWNWALGRTSSVAAADSSSE